MGRGSRWLRLGNTPSPRIDPRPVVEYDHAGRGGSEAETRNRAQVAPQMHTSRHRRSERLDLGIERRHDAGEGISLGECRLNNARNDTLHHFREDGIEWPG